MWNSLSGPSSATFRLLRRSYAEGHGRTEPGPVLPLRTDRPDPVEARAPRPARHYRIDAGARTRCPDGTEQPPGWGRNAARGRRPGVRPLFSRLPEGHSPAQSEPPARKDRPQAAEPVLARLPPPMRCAEAGPPTPALSARRSEADRGPGYTLPAQRPSCAAPLPCSPARTTREQLRDRAEGLPGNPPG